MNKRLHVGNLEYSTTNEELEELFSSEGNVVSAKVIRRLDGKSKGFAFVEMPGLAEAQKAINELNTKEVKGKKLTVNEARPRRGDNNRNKRGGGNRGGFNQNRRKY